MNIGFFQYFVLLVVMLGSCKSDRYNPDKFLSAEDQQKLIRASVYYAMKLPPNATHETKFYPEFKWYYDRATKEVALEKYYDDGRGNQYFLMTRAARSITPMREGIAGKIHLDKAGKMSVYEEVFRTWKMPADSLRLRGSMLFDRMVTGKDLSLFYSKFQGDKYIEYPNDRFSFDRRRRLWNDQAPGILQRE